MPLALIRVDASLSIGGGHVFRCMSLARYMNNHGWECTFLCTSETLETVPLLKQSGFNAIEADDIYPEPSDVVNCNRFDLIIFDHYSIDASYERQWRAYADCIVVIDDLADRHHDCDLLVDQTYGRDCCDYAGLVPDGCEILTGTEYAMLRLQFPEIRETVLADRRARKGEVKNILVSMGSTNNFNITGTVLDALDGWKGQALSINVVMGKKAFALDNVECIIGKINEKGYHKAELILDTSDMAGLMAKADLSIGAGGTTSWERCCLGLPTIMIQMAENQSLVISKLEEAGAVFNLGWYDKVSAEKIEMALTGLVSHPDKVTAMSDRASGLCSGNGVSVVVDLVEKKLKTLKKQQSLSCDDSSLVSLRPFRSDDVKTLFDWQSLPDMRKYFRNSNAPAWDEHINWCDNLVSDSDDHAYIIQYKDRPAGFARVSKLEAPNYEISILLDPAYRGKGIAKSSLSIIKKMFHGVALKAYIHPENKKSVALFKAAGFISEEGAKDWYILTG